MLANVATSAASQRFSASDDAQAATSYAQTCSPGWTPAFRGLLRLPCRTSSWSHRRGGQLRRGGCASAQRLVWIGGGGVGASLHPALAGRLIETDERIERRAALPSSGFQGQKKASQPPSLSEIAISLNCGQNSARKFQTGVSNSGPQIPKHARQNSEVPEITNFS